MQYCITIDALLLCILCFGLEFRDTFTILYAEWSKLSTSSVYTLYSLNLYRPGTTVDHKNNYSIVMCNIRNDTYDNADTESNRYTLINNMSDMDVVVQQSYRLFAICNRRQNGF